MALPYFQLAMVNREDGNRRALQHHERHDNPQQDDQAKLL
jgi:hypothetical protein